MQIAPGTRFGPFEIASRIGAGGMGEVYRAADTGLKRDVAIKVLPDSHATDADRLARFRREAEILASLNHPNIGQIYGLEKSNGRTALVMELIEGPTLADRIALGPIAVDEALRIAMQIAGALEAAHSQQIVHRDLKPANIKLRADGTVKVLDFGIAKILATQAPSSSSPDMTQVGALLGTATYMSPEQALGKAVDKRADIWAFGCVLYEMLTGQPAFGSEDMTVTIARVLEGSVDLHALPARVPARVHRTIELCLTKDVNKRIHDIGDVRLALEGEFGAFEPVAAPAAVRPFWRRALPVTVAFLAGGLAAGVSIWRLTQPVEDPAQEPDVRFDVATATFTDAASLALSPDGTMVAFEGSMDGQSLLWVHSFESPPARPLMGTESASLPFWSPDNRSLGFFADGKLKRIDLDTGSVRVLADAPIGRGGAWGAKETIIFAPGTNDPLLRVSSRGGAPSVITHVELTQAGHRLPQFLPDGEHFIYYATGSGDSRGEFLSDQSGAGARRLFDADTGAVFATSGHLFFTRQGALYAQPFEPGAQELQGTAFPVTESVAIDGAIYRMALTASATGSIAYRIAPQGGDRQFTWLDRTGVEIGTAGDSMSAVLSPAMSPDGRNVAFSRTVNGNQDIWLLNVESGDVSRFTFDPGLNFTPLWSPDGSRIIFSSNRSGVFDLYEKPATGVGAEKLLLATTVNKFAVDWSRDGKSLLYSGNDPDTSYDLWTLPLGNDEAEPVQFVRTRFDERDGQFSPDGKWVAYQSNESGRLEVYVQRFRGGGRWQISTNGGAQVRWSDDGDELFFLTLDGQLMAVPVNVTTGEALEAGAPQPLFTPRIGRGVQTSNRQQYMVSSGGERFLINALVLDATRTPIRMVLHWKEAR